MEQPSDWQLLAGRLRIPAATTALLWDMDGVLLDTLQLDFDIVDGLLLSAGVLSGPIPPGLIRDNFAYDPPEFWRRILAAQRIELPPPAVDRLVGEYEHLRVTSSPPVLDGVLPILADARASRLATAVVSNNPEADVVRTLANAGLRQYFDVVVGNDDPGVRKKPHPDPYLAAASRLSVSPGHCVVIEDSLLGAEAGSRAGCYVVGVATGGTERTALAASEFVAADYPDLAGPTDGALPVTCAARMSDGR